MSELEHAKRFSDLAVYRKAYQLAMDIFHLTEKFPKEEMYALTDQIRRSSRSIGAQIAEAWAKRRYEKSFISKLTDADGEQMETCHWLQTACDCGYFDGKQLLLLKTQSEEVGRMLAGMIAKSNRFCGVTSSADY